MIPGNRITPAPIVGSFSFPLDEDYDPLHHRVWGGVALGDSAQGRLFKLWEVSLVSGTISLGPVGEPVAMTVLAPGATSVCLAFDTAMRVTLCWTTATGVYLYYHDPLSQEYTSIFYNGLSSCRVCVDDPRSFYETESDVIFAYTRNGNLYWRQQRDRYEEERIIGPTPGIIVKVGLSSLGRLQFEIQGGVIQPIPDDLESLAFTVRVTHLDGFTPA